MIRIFTYLLLFIVVSSYNCLSQTVLVNPTELSKLNGYGVYALFGYGYQNNEGGSKNISKYSIGLSYSPMTDSDKKDTNLFFTPRFGIGYEIWNNLSMQDSNLEGVFSLGQATAALIGQHTLKLTEDVDFDVSLGVRIGFPVSKDFRLNYTGDVYKSTIADTLKQVTSNISPVPITMSATMPMTGQLFAGFSFSIFKERVRLIVDINESIFPLTNIIYTSLDDERKFGKFVKPLPVSKVLSATTFTLGISATIK